MVSLLSAEDPSRINPVPFSIEEDYVSVSVVGTAAIWPTDCPERNRTASVWTAEEFLPQFHPQSCQAQFRHARRQDRHTRIWCYRT